jgi:hypothetical protein
LNRHREKIRIIQDLLKKRQQNGNNCITIEHTETVQDANTQENNNAPINVQDEEMEEPEDGIYL